MERPECQIEGCHNPALILAFGKLICGDCLCEFNKGQNEIALKIIEDGRKKNKK